MVPMRLTSFSLPVTVKICTYDGPHHPQLTEEELGFLRTLTFDNKRPTPLYYYRELQSPQRPAAFSDLSQETSAR